MDIFNKWSRPGETEKQMWQRLVTYDNLKTLGKIMGLNGSTIHDHIKGLGVENSRKKRKREKR
jgi:hypothetical protein